jgi:hypothetical protein
MLLRDSRASSVSFTPLLLPVSTTTAAAVAGVAAVVVSATVAVADAIVGAAMPRYCSTLRRRVGPLQLSIALSSPLTLLRRLCDARLSRRCCL